MTLPAVVLENTSAIAQTNLPYTFGQVFKRGDLPAGSPVALVAAGGINIPCQVNVHATHSDGSAKHASLSLIAPNMAASAVVSHNLAIGTAAPTGAAPVPADYAALAAVVELTDLGTLVDGSTAGTLYTASLKAKLDAGQFTTYRTGPIMSEWVVRAPLLTAGGAEHPGLHVRFHCMVYKGQQRARIHVVVENTWAKPLAVPVNTSPWDTNTSNLTYIYAYKVKVGGATVDERLINGYHHTSGTFDSRGTYRNYLSGLPNDGTLFKATVVIDGVTKNVSVAGSAAQTYGALFDAVTAQLGGIGKFDSSNNSGVRFSSLATGAASTAKITDFGTLMPALIGTTMSSSKTAPVTYTMSVAIDGVVKPVSVVGHANLSFGYLAANITAQLGGLATAVPQLAAPGIAIINKRTGNATGVVITDTNLISKITAAVLKVRRPIRGDEYVHYPHTFWKKTFWWGTEAPRHVSFDKAYWISTHAVPNYDPTLTGDAATIASNLADMKANEDIGRNGITKAGMGGPGYAPGIGVLPEWTALYFVSQNRDARYVMMKQADLQGSWPVNVREYDTGAPLSFAKWPSATFSPNAGDSKNKATGLNEKLPTRTTPSYISATINEPDVSHHPDFAFLPYLITGDLFYRELLEYYFNFTILDMNAAGSYRGGGLALFKAQGQTRGKAWAFRTMAHTLWALPDGHPRKAEITQIMANNISWFNAAFVDPAGPEYNVFGHLGGLIYTGNGLADSSNAPWQDDFVTAAVGRSVELGFTDWLPLLQFKSRQIKGRLTSGAAFCYQVATAYTLRYRDDATSPQYTSWAEVYNKGFPSTITMHPCGSPELTAAIGETITGTLEGYPTSLSGYPANMQPAVAYTASYKMPGCEDAWLVFDARPAKPNYNKGPQFAIVPRTLSDVQVPALPTVGLFRSTSAGLGGAISTIAAGSDIFDKVVSTESANGATEYRCEYVKNQDATKTLQAAVLWLSANTPSPGTRIEVGLGTSGINGTEQVVASQTTAPAGVTFGLAATKAAAVALGNLPPNGYRAVWYKRVTDPGAAAATADSFTRTVEGSI